jgi:acyl dehydratase
MTTTTNKPKEANTPKYHAYSVAEAKGDGQKARWHRIGTVFAHDDGEGATLVLDSLPIHFDGRIVLRAPKTEQGAGQ